MPQYTEIAAEAERYRQEHLKSINFKDENIALFVVDAQIGFCNPQASMFVTGAVEDISRICKFIYASADKLAKLYFSLDTHKTFQIFHSAFWIDAAGKRPKPFTTITAEAVI